jgi:hydroxymethylpyrimidine pyrophosphatase-like HAD family hydrolase
MPKEQIASIGDMPNEIFRESGLSIAMGNAGSRAKAQARLITDSYNEKFVTESGAHAARISRSAHGAVDHMGCSA